MQILKGKKILVTGATGGIGKAIVKQLSAEGAEMVMHFLDDEDQAQQTADSITRSTGVAYIVQADLSKQEEAIALGEKAWELLNGIDVLVNNAGVSYRKHFLDTTVEDVDHFLNINFKGTLWLTKTIAAKMVANKKAGSIYTITSINGLQPGVGFSLYGATKGAVETLMKGIALELAPHNITVNTIAPGAIHTGINEAVWQDEERLKTVNENIPMGRFGQPEEIASVLCSLIAFSTYMTGVTITIDGGWLLKHGFVKPEKYNSNT